MKNPEKRSRDGVWVHSRHLGGDTEGPYSCFAPPPPQGPPEPHSPCFQERARAVRTGHPGHPGPGWHRSTPLGRSRLVSCTRRGWVAAQSPAGPSRGGMEAEKHGGPEKQGQRNASVAMRGRLWGRRHAPEELFILCPSKEGSGVRLLGCSWHGPFSMAVSCEMDITAISAHGCGCCPEAMDMEHEATQQGGTAEGCWLLMTPQTSGFVSKGSD